MTLTAVASPLAKMVETTPTDYWNDSCAVAELEYAVERGGTGATSNPTIVGEVMKKEKDHWVPRVREIAAANPIWSEVEITWALIEEMGARGAAILAPVFEAHDGKKGRLSLQTNPANYRDPERMAEQAVHFSTLAPNIQVKFPCTAEGLAGRRGGDRPGRRRQHHRRVHRGPVHRGRRGRRARPAPVRGRGRRHQPDMTPVCSLMIGRLDDWMKVLVDRDSIALDPDAANWAGVAAFKRAYGIFQERGYRTRLLAAAYRHRLHWTELVGGDVVLTMPHAWQVRFNNSGIDPVSAHRCPGRPGAHRRPAARGSRTSVGPTSRTAWPLPSS